VLEKEGIEEGTPEYTRITSKLQQYREDQAQQGHYFKRADAYAMLKAQGKLVPAKAKKPVKKVVVVKSKPHVAINRTTNKSNKADVNKKTFKTLPLAEKEKALENVKF
jgi:dephospho-CoA kinase